MIQFEEILLELENLYPEIENLSQAMGINMINQELTKLEKDSAHPDFWKTWKILKKSYKE